MYRREDIFLSYLNESKYNISKLALYQDRAIFVGVYADSLMSLVQVIIGGSMRVKTR